MSVRVWPAFAALVVLLIVGWFAVKLLVSLACYLIAGLVVVGAGLYLCRRARRTGGGPRR